MNKKRMWLCSLAGHDFKTIKKIEYTKPSIVFDYDFEAVEGVHLMEFEFKKCIHCDKLNTKEKMINFGIKQNLGIDEK